MSLADELEKLAGEARAAGMADERAAIVNWLNAQPRRYDNHALCYAVRIVKGEHWAGQHMKGEGQP